ncbi:hypothetical protein MTX78_04275 [Hymenobacter tibetensis]|uniref:Tetratricopeptide repeat protein n=1 Tax=Hymenobacter tibetensis TaxID=497967 RepID=A0ABY4D0F8_9BACT|nr:tetratricopeptide repeat protein [Hymenobacter tibetensis]UOG75817.1 hypothetical protein MTX78_04275 [Hymenobacter tibetensis]
METIRTNRWQEAVRQLLAVRRPAQAEQLVRRRLATHPQDAEVYEQLALTLLNQPGRLHEALEVVHQAIALNPESSDAHYFHSIARLRNSQTHEALQAINEALRLHSHSAQYFGYKAVILNSLQQPEEALQAAKSGLFINPGHLECLYQRVQAFRQLNKSTAAAATIKEVARWHPNAAVTHRLLAEEAYDQDEFPIGEMHVREAIRLEPTNSRCQRLLLLILLQRGHKAISQTDIAAARTFFLEAWQLDPANVTARKGIERTTKASLQLHRQWRRCDAWLDGLKYRNGWHQVWAWPLLLVLAVLIAYLCLPILALRIYIAVQWRRHPDVRLIRCYPFSAVAGWKLLVAVLAGVSAMSLCVWLVFYL